MADTYDVFDTPSNRTVVVALDHGLNMGVLDGFEDPEATLRAVLAGGPDGVLVGPHFARRFASLLDDAAVEVLLTADAALFSTRPGQQTGDDVWTPAFSVPFLRDFDPSGVKVALAFGRDDRRVFERNVAYVCELAEQLHGTGIPLVVEPVMWGRRVPDDRATDPDLVANGARLAWEYGADVLKVPYTGSVETFESIVDAAPVPVTILGGPSSGDPDGLLHTVADAVDAGARGLVVGRSIWQTPDPERIVRALTAVVHDGTDPDDAWSAARTA
jgi:DhnA family fructose-bisphosphate aldolase class Ia